MIDWQAHPEVWLVTLLAFACAGYVVRVIQPKMVAVGHRPVTWRQKAWFLGAVAVFWLCSDWPIHDLAEQRLYLVHMVQHLLLTFVMPPMVLLATPEWLARLVLDGGRFGRWFTRVLCKPLLAAVAFNAAVALSHAAPVVNGSVRNPFLHYGVHLVLVLLAFAMWMAVCGALPERRLSKPAQMVYLFMMSVLPTVPAAFLTVADNPLYRAYDHGPRMLSITVVEDQQYAGLIMKIGGGTYLWALITLLFFRWAVAQAKADSLGRLGNADRSRRERADLLTYQEVAATFERIGPPPVDAVPPKS